MRMDGPAGGAAAPPQEQLPVRDGMFPKHVCVRMCMYVCNDQKSRSGTRAVECDS